MKKKEMVVGNVQHLITNPRIRSTVNGKVLLVRLEPKEKKSKNSTHLDISFGLADKEGDPFLDNIFICFRFYPSSAASRESYAPFMNLSSGPDSGSCSF